eukprot:12619985-Ditylum_brightwellii.AAC.1
MKVCVDDSREKAVMPKYFLQIPIYEDGRLAEACDDRGKVITSGSNLHKLFPPNVKPRYPTAFHQCLEDRTSKK